MTKADMGIFVEPDIRDRAAFAEEGGTHVEWEYTYDERR